MSAAELRIHSLETQLEALLKRLDSLERELDTVRRRKSRLILEMCDMEERLIEQSKEIKALRTQLKWAKEPSSAT
jgi:chromosome segregation ATPase